MLTSLGSRRNLGRNSPVSNRTSYGTLRTIWEVDYAALPSQTLVSGSLTTSFGGLLHYHWPTAGSQANIITGQGLAIVLPTTAAETAVDMVLFAGINNVPRLISSDRLRRGKWAVWVKTSNYTMSAGGWAYAPLIYAGGYPNWGFANRRGYNVNGTAANATGGWAGWQCGGVDTGGVLYGANTSSAQVSMLYFRSLWEIEHYYGNWTNGTWPLMEDMTLGMVSRPAGQYRVDGTNGVRCDPNVMYCHLGGAGNATQPRLTYEKIRFTVWD